MEAPKFNHLLVNGTVKNANLLGGMWGSMRSLPKMIRNSVSVCPIAGWQCNLSSCYPNWINDCYAKSLERSILAMTKFVRSRFSLKKRLRVPKRADRTENLLNN